MKRLISHALALAVILLIGRATAQDAHYWTNEYGTRAQLLGGIVIGSIKDLSATFYNPGAIAFSTDVYLQTTADAIEFTQVISKGGAGREIDLRSFKAGVSPGVFAARFAVGKEQRHQFAISWLTRHDANFEADGRRIDSRESIENGQNAFSGELLFAQSMLEFWIGLSWAYKLTNRIGIGVTQYVPIRSQRLRSQVLGQQLSPNGEVVAANLIDEDKFFNFRLLWKAGLIFDLRPLTFGLTLTTPSVHLTGSGSTLTNVSLPGTSAAGGAIQNTVFASDFQDKLQARFKSPTSFAVGASYQWGPLAIHAAFERFLGLKPFQIMRPKPFRQQSSGSVVTPEITHGLKGVNNYGFGLNYKLKEYLSFYAGFRSDFSALDKTAQSDVAIANWDIHHLTFGFVSSFRTVDLTLGVGYAFGQSVFERTLDFSAEQPDVLLQTPQFNEVSFRRFKLIIGLSLTLPGSEK